MPAHDDVGRHGAVNSSQVCSQPRALGGPGADVAFRVEHDDVQGPHVKGVKQPDGRRVVVLQQTQQRLRRVFRGKPQRRVGHGEPVLQRFKVQVKGRRFVIAREGLEAGAKHTRETGSATPHTIPAAHGSAPCTAWTT